MLCGLAGTTIYKLLSGYKPVYLLRKAQSFAAQFGHAVRTITDPRLNRSYYPELPRKGRARMLLDQLIWLVKSGEANQYYFCYGLDRKDASLDQYLPYKHFRRMRNDRNRKNGTHFDYVCLLQDKFIFSQFLASLKFPAPRNVALWDSRELTWLDTMERVALEQLSERGNEEWFCKPLTGIAGRGSFCLGIDGGRLVINGEEASIGALRQRLRGRYLFQERLVQHPRMAELHAASINTLRLVTCRCHDRVDLISANIRMGTNGKVVDNWSSGGIVIAVDQASGILAPEGFFKPGYGGRVRRHPTSGVIFEGFEVPQYRACVELVKAIHSHFYGIHSIGWDVVITPSGPVVIEGNDDWGSPMTVEPAFKNVFLKVMQE